MDSAQTYSCICDVTYRCSPFNVGSTKQRNEIIKIAQVLYFVHFQRLCLNVRERLHKCIAVSVMRCSPFNVGTTKQRNENYHNRHIKRTVSIKFSNSIPSF